jgi:hypothetical protein
MARQARTGYPGALYGIMTRGDQSPIRTLPNRIQRSGHRDMIMALAGCSLLKPIEEELKRTSKKKPRELENWGDSQKKLVTAETSPTRSPR